MPLIPGLPEADTAVATLANGVRVLTLRLPALQTASVSVFVRCGSGHEGRLANGIGHVIEHMAFKGTAQRDARGINFDAERLGAEVNAHTDKDHTAFHMRGLGPHAPLFVRMLGEIVRHATFPDAELQREREVLLHEFTEDEDDPMSTAFKLFDRACWGLHPLAQPVIGTRRNIERFSRDDLVAHVRRLYSGANIVVAAAGAIDVDAVVREAEGLFGDMPRGQENPLTAPAWRGGIRAKAQAGSSQTHLVLGFPIAPLQADDPTAALAAALLGEGMSSPLMDQLREQRGLVYYAACSADRLDHSAEFVIEASFAPDQLGAVLREVVQLLVAQSRAIDPIDLERAHNQIAVRWLRGAERPTRRLEEAALDLFALQRVRSHAERVARLASVTAEEVRAVFERMLATPASLAVAGRVGRGVGDQAREGLAALHASRVA
jgi:predicted Zn-dependent peptidase